MCKFSLAIFVLYEKMKILDQSNLLWWLDS